MPRQRRVWQMARRGIRTNNRLSGPGFPVPAMLHRSRDGRPATSLCRRVDGTGQSAGGVGVVQ